MSEERKTRTKSPFSGMSLNELPVTVIDDPADLGTALAEAATNGQPIVVVKGVAFIGTFSDTDKRAMSKAQSLYWNSKNTNGGQGKTLEDKALFDARAWAGSLALNLQDIVSSIQDAARVAVEYTDGTGEALLNALKTLRGKGASEMITVPVAIEYDPGMVAIQVQDVDRFLVHANGDVSVVGYTQFKGEVSGTLLPLTKTLAKLFKTKKSSK